MIKAVSRQILEVSDTGNAYFEKAWLMLDPQFMNVGASQLEREAEDYLKDLDAPAAVKSRKRAALRLLNLLAAAAGGGLVTAAFFQLY